MMNNLEKYKKDLEQLEKKGDLLFMSIRNECFPEQFAEALGDKAKEYTKTLPRFNDSYQAWYSEAKGNGVKKGMGSSLRLTLIVN